MKRDERDRKLAETPGRTRRKCAFIAELMRGMREGNGSPTTGRMPRESKRGQGRSAT